MLLVWSEVFKAIKIEFGREDNCHRNLNLLYGRVCMRIKIIPVFTKWVSKMNNRDLVPPTG